MKNLLLVSRREHVGQIIKIYVLFESVRIQSHTLVFVMEAEGILAFYIGSRLYIYISYYTYYLLVILLLIQISVFDFSN